MVPRENFFTGNKSFRGFRIRASRSLPPSPRDKRHISLSKGGMGSLWGRKVCEKKKKTLLSFAAPPRQNSRWFCPPGNARNRMQKAVFIVRIAGIVVFGLPRTNFLITPLSFVFRLHDSKQEILWHSLLSKTISSRSNRITWRRRSLPPWLPPPPPPTASPSRPSIVSPPRPGTIGSRRRRSSKGPAWAVWRRLQNTLCDVRLLFRNKMQYVVSSNVRKFR